MSAEEIARDFLDHHGVKGQRWGVRRAQAHKQSGVEKAVNRQLRTAGQTHREKKAARKDKKWQKNIYKTKSAIAVHNNVADKMNHGGLDSLNNSVRFAKMNNKSNPELKAAYYRAYEKMNESFTRQAVNEVHGVSPSGRYKATLDTSHDQWSVTVVPNDAQHANEPTPKIVTEVDHDENGFVTLHKNVREPMAQTSVKMGEEFIEHFGVKGQKWGVRKDKLARKAGLKPKTKAEEKRINSRRNLVKNRRSLSDEDIKKAIDRLSNEKKLKELVNSDIQPGQTVAKRILGESGQKVAKAVIVGATMFAIKVAVDKKMNVVRAPGEPSLASLASKYIAPLPKNK